MTSVNLGNIILNVLPPKKRKTNFIAWMNVLYKPLYTIQLAFNLFFDEIEYELKFNGQVIYLEHVLNDYFDEIARGIYITDTIQLTQVVIYNSSEENEHTYIFNDLENNPLVLFNTLEFDSDVDFVVNIPSGVYVDLVQLKIVVNKYKILGKTYKINQL